MEDSSPLLFPLTKINAKFDYKISDDEEKLLESLIKRSKHVIPISEMRTSRKNRRILHCGDNNVHEEIFDSTKETGRLKKRIHSENNIGPDKVEIGVDNEVKTVEKDGIIFVENGKSDEMSLDSSDENDTSTIPFPSPHESPKNLRQQTSNMMRMCQNEDMRQTFTQIEMLSYIFNFISRLTEKNRNYLSFKLLQLNDRSILSAFNCMIKANLKRNIISNLPLEISYKIFSYLDYRDLIAASVVCKSWYNIINTDMIWIKLLIKDKFIVDKEVILKELSKSKVLMEEWSENKNTCIAQILYKKRCTIFRRWMNPNYEPRRISYSGNGNKVVTCLEFDDQKIVTGVDDKHIVIYSTKTGDYVRTLKGHEGGVWALKYTGNTLITGSTDRTARVWNLKTGECIHIYKGHTLTIRCLDIIHPTNIGKDANGKDIIFPRFSLIVTGSRDHNMHVWQLPVADINNPLVDDFHLCSNDDLDDPYLVAVLSGHTQSVRSVLGHGNIVISGSYDSTVRVWDLMNNASCKHVLIGHHDRVYSIAMDFENKTCFSGSMDSTINVWNFETGLLLHTMKGHTSLVGLLSLSKQILVSAGADTLLRIWNSRTGECYCKLEGHTGAITCFDHDDLKVVSGSEKMLKLWSINEKKFIRNLLPDLTGGIWQVKIDYKKCIAAVQKLSDDGHDETYIEMLDFSEPIKKASKH